MSGPDTWSPDRTEKAVRLWREGNSATTIAKALGGGLSRSAVVGKMHRLGLSRAPATSRIGTYLAASGRIRAIQAGRGQWRIDDEELPAPSVTETPHARPWMTRRFNECAFPVDGEGTGMRACCAPGRLWTVGAAAYCDAHHAAMVCLPRDERRGDNAGRRGPRVTWDPDASVLPEWDAA